MVKQDIALSPSTTGYWYIFSENQLLVTQQRQVPKCSWKDLDFAAAYAENVMQIGTFDSIPCFVIDMGQQGYNHQSLSQISLREYISEDKPEYFAMASRAYQLMLFVRTHKYCGQCGNTMDNVGWELAMQCNRCNHRAYPRISPCIIVAIVHQKRILLARGKRHKAGLFSILAGFVDSGESLEHAVHREVMEEVGVKIKNLEYIESQPWPFPHQLMCGFIADYDSGDITVDGHEILSADWFDFGSLPLTPAKETISGRLIALAKQRQEKH